MKTTVTLLEDGSHQCVVEFDQGGKTQNTTFSSSRMYSRLSDGQVFLGNPRQKLRMAKTPQELAAVAAVAKALKKK